MTSNHLVNVVIQLLFGAVLIWVVWFLMGLMKVPETLKMILGIIVALLLFVWLLKQIGAF
jgi:hypothetical protein